MSLSLTALLTPATSDAIKAKLYELADVVGLQTTNWFSGAPTRTLFAVTAGVLDGYQRLAVLVTGSGFLDYAKNEWLTRLAHYVYGVDRIEATFASGLVTVTNGGGGVFSWEPGDFILQNTATGVTYANLELVSFSGSGSGDFLFIAQTEGTGGNAAPTEIDALVTTAQSVTVSNPGAFVGVDREEDPALRDRCRASLGPLSPNGPQRAIEYVATTPDLVGGVAVTRVRVETPLGDGVTHVLLAGPAGELSAPAVALVQAGLDLWATAEVQTILAASADNLVVDQTATVYVPTGILETSEWEALLTEAFEAYINALDIGGVITTAAGHIPWRAIVGVLKGVRVGDATPVLTAELAVETDVPVADTEVPVPGTLTLTVVQV